MEERSSGAAFLFGPNGRRHSRRRLILKKDCALPSTTVWKHRGRVQALSHSTAGMVFLTEMESTRS